MASVGQEGAGLLAHVAALARGRLGPSPLAGLAKQSEGLPGQLAGAARIGMPLDEQVERSLPQRRQHPRGMTQPDGCLPQGEQLFEQVVDSQVGRCADQHALTGPHGLVDQGGDGRCLAGPRRAVYDSDVRAVQAKCNGPAL